MLEALIFAQKIYEFKYFKKIFEYNVQHPKEWEHQYPHHVLWIEKAYEDLKTNSRIAFGAFIFDPLSGKNEFCGSVMIKKNLYTPELELKNIIVFEEAIPGNLKKSKESLDQCRILIIKSLVTKVLAYSGYRGFKRITAEVKQKADLLGSFLDLGFVISGTKTPKYFDADGIVFLNYEVDSAYSLDPFDNLASARWILKKFLKAEDFENTPEMIEIKEKRITVHHSKFFTGKKYEKDVENKFNIKSQCITIPESSGDNISDDGLDVHLNLEEFPPLVSNYIFDFTVSGISKNINNPVWNVFNRDDTLNLLGDHYRLRSRFSETEINGILIVSNPFKFNFTKQGKLDKHNFFTYIKSGNYGKYLSDEMHVLLAHFSSESQDNFRIWGYGKLADVPDVVDLGEKKGEIKTIVGDAILNFNDADILWFDEYKDEVVIEDSNELQRRFNPLWDKETFLTHNTYNQTNQVVLLNLIEFEDIRKTSIAVSSIIEDKMTFNHIRNEAEETYLTTSELNRFLHLVTDAQRIDGEGNIF